MRRARLLLTLVAVSAASCQLFYPFDLDAGGGDEAGDTNAGDVAPGDAGACDGFCACLSPKPKLCHDFDDGSLVGPFDPPNPVGNTATAALDTTRFVSPPASGRFAYESLDGAAQGWPLIDQLLSPVSEATIRSKINLGSKPPSYGTFETLSLYFPSGAEVVFGLSVNGEVLLMNCTSPCTTLGDAAAYGTFPLKDLGPNVWTDVEMHVTFGASFSVTVTYDGTVAGGIDAGLYSFPPSTPKIEVGADFVKGTTGPLSLNLDDIVIDYP